MQLSIVFLTALVGNVMGHGYLAEPPNRSTLWRYQDTDPAITPYKSIVVANYNDNQNFCGGFQVSWKLCPL